MKTRYSEPISKKEARSFLRRHFDGVRIPHQSRCLWVAGVRWVTDQPGCYLVASELGLEGVMIVSQASEQELKAS